MGFLDETWWRRLARPALNSWNDAGEPLRLVEQSVAKDDPDPKAICCYGLFLPEFEEVWLRFVDGRLVSGITTRFLSWCYQKLEAAGKKVWVLIWDNASWHISHEVRQWIDERNRALKKSRGEGLRTISCLLPKKSPGLNPIEPKWVHGKRRVVEAEGLLGAYELADRVCVQPSIVRITNICLSSKMSPDHALGPRRRSRSWSGASGSALLSIERSSSSTRGRR